MYVKEKERAAHSLLTAHCSLLCSITTHCPHSHCFTPPPPSPPDPRSPQVRGPSDHNFVHSIYFRDPNGYVIELTCPVKVDPRSAHWCSTAGGTCDRCPGSVVQHARARRSRRSPARTDDVVLDSDMIVAARL
jgi:hypothetical protein